MSLLLLLLSCVQALVKDLLSIGYGPQLQINNVVLHAEGKHQEEDVVGTPQVHKSDIAAYLPASAVIAADAKQKHEAARDLQSHHSSSSEWFICDEPEICTRCFVIHVTIQVIQYYILIVPR